MPADIVDVNAFTSPVVRPVDSDPRNAASVFTPFQALSDRTRRLLNIAQGTENVESAQSFKRVVGAEWFDAPTNPGGVIRWELSGSNAWAATAAGVGNVRGSLNDLLPEGCTITRLRAMVTPATARTGANRMLLELRRVTYTLPAAPAVTPASDSSAVVFSAFDDLTTAQQMIDSTVISEPISKSTIDLVVSVASGTGGSAGDLVHMLEITYTDPGRRW